MNNDRSRMCSQIGRGTRTQRTSAAPVSEIDKALGVTGYRQPKSLSTAATQVGTSSAAPKYKEQASRGGGGYGGRDRAYGNGNGGDPMADLSKQYGELQVSAGGARGEGQYGQRRRRHRDRGQNRYSADRYLGHSSGEEDGKAYAPPTYTSGTSRRKSSRRY
ncbi:hypothetical protein FQN49_007774 [Arthroderma sp. PD_2]|nr:hypothetical protein FQN49_007774 [Arthroderma sp. PD_2]